jgi:phosphatidylserine decarboxylase
MVSEPNAVSQFLALFTPVHRDGYKFLGIAAAVTVVAFLLSSTLGLLGVAAMGGLAFFFRDPVRVVPDRGGLIVSPADGTVIGVETMAAPDELGLGNDPLTRISIFLSLLDVHVNRAPVSGRVVTSVYKPGEHHNAAASLAPKVNERHSFVITTKQGVGIGVVLISGAAARRIVTSVKEGDSVATGERIGIIRFGSRVDLYLPPSQAIFVAEGQRMFGGETVIADLETHEPPRGFRRI